MQQSQQLLPPLTEPDSDTQRDHCAAPKDRSSQQQPSCELSPNMACHSFNSHLHQLACENASSLDVVSELAALRAAVREQNCFMSNNLERVLDEQRGANKIVLSTIHRLQNDVAQLKLAANPPSHLPFSHFVGEKDNISRGFTQGDAIPQTYIVATPSPRPPPPPSFPTNFFMAPYPLATPPSHAMTDLKAELERCTTLPPPTQSSPNISTASHAIRSPRYAFNTCHEDDAMSVEQALAPTVYSWSPKPNTPPQRLSDSDQEEERSTTDVESPSPNHETTKLNQLLTVLEHKTVTSDDSEESTDFTSGTRTPPIVPTSRFTPYFVEHPRSLVPTPEWVVRCNIYGEVQKKLGNNVDDTHNETGARGDDSAGILDDQRVETPPVLHIPTPVSPTSCFHHHQPKAVPNDHPPTSATIVIDPHYDIDPVWVRGGAGPAGQTEDGDMDLSRVTTPALPIRLSVTPSVCRTGEEDDDIRSASASEPIRLEIPPLTENLSSYHRGSPTLPTFYTVDHLSMIGGPTNNNYLEPLASPSEEIFTRSPPPSFSPSRCSSPPLRDGLMFKSSVTLQAPMTPPHLYFGQQPPARPPSELSERYLSPSLIPVADNVQMYDYRPISRVSSRPPSVAAAIPPSPPPRIYGTPTSSSSSSTSSPSLRCDDDAMSPTFLLRSVTPPKMTPAARSESTRSTPSPDLRSPTGIMWVPTYGGVPLDSSSPLMPSAQRGPRPQARAPGSPVITPALTADYTHSPTGSAAITYGSPRPMISPTNSLGLQDDTAFPEQTLTLRQAEDSSLRMQRLENLVEMLQTKVLSLTDEMSTIKGSPTTPRMHAATPPPLARHSDISSPPPPMFFYTPPARTAGFVTSSPKSETQPQSLAPLGTYSDRLASPPSNQATVSMMATPLTSAPSSRVPYPKSPEMERPPVSPIVSAPVRDMPELKPSPRRRRQRTATAIPPPEVTYGGGMTFGDVCSLGQESSDGNNNADRRLSSPAPSPLSLPLRVACSHFEASPPPAPVTLNLEQPARANVVIPHSPPPFRSTSPAAPQGETTRTPSKPLHLGKMARPRRARKRQLDSVNNGANASSPANKVSPVIVPPPCYLQDAPEVLVMPEPPTLPRLQESSLNKLPSFVPAPLFDFPETTQDRQPFVPAPLFHFPETAQDRQPILSPPSPPSPVPSAPFQYDGRPYQFSPWRPGYSGVAPRPVTSLPPIGPRSSFPTLTPAYEAVPPPLPFLHSPGMRGAASQAPYQHRRSRPRGTVRNGAAPPISVLAPAPLGPVTRYPVPNGATGMGPTARAYVPHISPYNAPSVTRPPYSYVNAPA